MHRFPPTVKIFTEEPSVDFTGMVPAFLSHIAKGGNGTVCACFKFLNEISLKSANLDKLVNNGELCCITYDKGRLKAIAVYDFWVNQFIENKASGVLLSPGGEEFSTKENVGIQRISKQSYNKMARLCVPLIRV